MTYGINLRTGQNWQIDEVEMSEVEVEAEVQGELLDAAREIVRTEVRSVHFLRDVATHEPQPGIHIRPRL